MCNATNCTSLYVIGQILHQIGKFDILDEDDMFEDERNIETQEDIFTQLHGLKEVVEGLRKPKLDNDDSTIVGSSQL